jgi:outer membrane protein OmpA-like peptidoglycan-associated protein/uncharacterized surface protein with fasciclin (FAS1) repeats
VRPELLLTDATVPVSRYRRRIVAVGIVAAVVLVAVGAPFYLRTIERDLERRVPDELAAVGVTGLTASFSGQEGVLRCAAPLSDPEGVLDLAHEIDGVTTVTLERSCRVGAAPAASTVSPPPTSRPASDAQAGAAADPVDQSSADTGTDIDIEEIDETARVAEFDTVGEIVRSDPRFSVVGSLVVEAGLEGVLDGGESLTLFAPHDAAFDDVPADVLAELRNQPDLLAEVLRHHVVARPVELAELDDLARTSGRVTTMHAAEVTLGRSDASTTIDGATVVSGDLRAGNGVVHVIDRLLLPTDLELRSLSGLPEFVAVLRAGTLEMSGTVDAAAQRERLVAAATGSLRADNVTEDIEIDSASPFSGPSVDAMVELLAVVPGALTTGSTGYDGSEVFVVGTVVDADARAVLAEIAQRHEVRLELAERPTATADDIDELVAEIDALTSAEPFEFAPNSADLASGAESTLDRAAALVKRFDGLLVTVEGHTDTAGTAAVNAQLSESRAAAVYSALVDRGVPEAQLGYVGRGGDSPVLEDGIEDRVASRRVVFVVERADSAE